MANKQRLIELRDLIKDKELAKARYMKTDSEGNEVCCIIGHMARMVDPALMDTLSHHNAQGIWSLDLEDVSRRIQEAFGLTDTELGFIQAVNDQVSPIVVPSSIEPDAYIQIRGSVAAKVVLDRLIEQADDPRCDLNSLRIGKFPGGESSC